MLEKSVESQRYSCACSTAQIDSLVDGRVLSRRAMDDVGLWKVQKFLS